MIWSPSFFSSSMLNWSDSASPSAGRFSWAAGVAGTMNTFSARQAAAARVASFGRKGESFLSGVSVHWRRHVVAMMTLPCIGHVAHACGRAFATIAVGSPPPFQGSMNDSHDPSAAAASRTSTPRARPTWWTSAQSPRPAASPRATARSACRPPRSRRSRAAARRRATSSRRRPHRRIQAAKRTADLIPLCHPLPLTQVQVEFVIDEPRARCTAGCRPRPWAAPASRWRP